MTKVEPRFRWTCSYMGRQEFEVIDETGTYRVETRYEASDYQRGISSYDDQGWQREVVDAIGLLYRYHGRLDQPIPQSTVDAFNAWRLAEHQAFVKLLRDHPDKYGTNAADGVEPPMVVRGARYVVGTGWVVNEETATAGGRMGEALAVRQAVGPM
jgi:hypothetical protein